MKAQNWYVLTMMILSSFSLMSQSKTDTLTNEKIIQLSKIGLQPSVIINKIQTSYTYFDVSTEGLIHLSTNGVSAEVINEMMKTNFDADMAIANQKDFDDPATPRASGIYYFNPLTQEKKLRKVDPAVVSTSKSGGVGISLAFAATYGIAKESLKSELAGSKSNLQIEEASPEFYFYFEENTNPYEDSWFFASATSPNEFVLVKFDEKKSSREMIVGDMNAFGGSSGIPNKVKVSFSYEEINPGIYKVFFKQPLKSGEYCFIYANSTPTRRSNDKVFDFGIKYPK